MSLTNETGDLKSFVESEANRLASLCTSCGRCFNVCPMTKYANLSDQVKAGDVIDGVKEILRGERGSADAIEWTRVCTWSGSCIPECPESIDPLMMLRLARIIATGATGGEKRILMKDDPQYFARIKMFARLQLSPGEFDEWI